MKTTLKLTHSLTRAKIHIKEKKLTINKRTIISKMSNHNNKLLCLHNTYAPSCTDE